MLCTFLYLHSNKQFSTVNNFTVQGILSLSEHVQEHIDNILNTDVQVIHVKHEAA